MAAVLFQAHENLWIRHLTVAAGVGGGGTPTPCGTCLPRSSKEFSVLFQFCDYSRTTSSSILRGEIS